MKKKPGRPKLKASERKEILPIRFSKIELKELRRASKGQPLTTWMRETLLAAAQGRIAASAGIKAMVDEATGVTPGAGRIKPIPAPPTATGHLRPNKTLV